MEYGCSFDGLNRYCTDPNNSIIIPPCMKNNEQIEIMELTIMNKNFSVLPNFLFENMKIININLRSNKIEKISNNSFDYFDNTELIDLSRNLIKEINSQLFKHSTLQILIISENQLESIEENSFQMLFKLKILDLKSNKLKLLPKNIFLKMNNSLKLIYTDRNNIESLEETGIENLS